MSMSQQFVSVNLQYPIKAYTPGPEKPWSALEILYLKITPSLSLDRLLFSIHQQSGRVSGFTIDEFMNLLANSKCPALRKLAKPMQYPDPTPKVGPLDIKIERNCYVVFELDRRCDWEFRPALDGLSTTQAASEGYQYFSLFHCNDQGFPYEGIGLDPVPEPNRRASQKCRFAYFSAYARGEDEKPTDDGLNIYIQNNQEDGSNMVIILDPDVQNPGGPHTLE
jgi:hypothetical protein